MIDTLQVIDYSYLKTKCLWEKVQVFIAVNSPILCLIAELP